MAYIPRVLIGWTSMPWLLPVGPLRKSAMWKISQAHYSIKETYKTHFVDVSRVSWDNFVWNRPSVPKGNFGLWMIMLDKLKKKNKLMQHRVLDNDLCPICLSAAESPEHLFFECHFSSLCLKKLQKWLNIQTLPTNLSTIIKKRWKGDNFKKKVLISSICSLCYHIWRTRNIAIWLMHMNFVDKVMYCIC